MDILMVTPADQPGLSGGQELARVAGLSGGMTIRLLDGPVDRQKLELALDSDQVDVVHFAQHGDRLVLQLCDGALEAGELAQMLRKQRRLQFVVLNACNSVPMAVELYNDLSIPVVAHSAPVDDRAAVRLAELLYRLVASGMPLTEAVDRSRRTLERLYPGSGLGVQVVSGGSLSPALVRALEQRMCDAAAGMEQLRGELMAEFAKVTKRLDISDGRLLELEAKMAELTQSRWGLWLLGLLLVAQVATLIANIMVLGGR